MFKRFRIRLIGVVAVLATAGSMAMLALALPLTSAANSPEKEFSRSFAAPCVVAPGILNVRASANFAVHLKGPEEVHSNEEVTFREAGVTVTNSTEATEPLFDIGARGVKLNLTRFLLDAEGMQPPTVNLAGAQEGIVPLEKGKPFSFSSPPVSFTEKVTAAPGEHAGLSVDSSPGFEEVEPQVFRETGKGIVFTLETFNSEGVRELGPLQVVCTAPSGVTLASYVVGGKIVHCTTTTPRPLFVTLQPKEGPEGGGTEVTIEGEVGSVTEVLFGGVEVGFHPSMSGLVAVSPPGHGTVGVRVIAPGDECGNGHEGSAAFTYVPGNEKFQQNGWALSGSLTDKRLGQAITLPTGSTFNGSGELNNATGAGSVTGNVSIPAFSAPLKLFGSLPASVGLSLTQSGAINGTLAKSEVIPGAESFSLPVKLNVGITSLEVVGLKIPAKCTTAEPLVLGLMSALSREELLHTGWSFSGAATLPKIRCEGGLLGRLFGPILSALLSGPENAYALSFKPPSA